MNRSKVIGILTFSALMAVILGYTAVSLINNNPISEMEDLGAAADFTLPSIDGSNYTMSSDAGKVRVMTMVYTKCGAGCAVVVSKMNSVYKQLIEKELNQNVKFITIDFDYKYDNMSDLSNFATAFNNNTSQWQWLLGDKNQTDKVTDDYGFYFEEEMMDMNSTDTTQSEHEDHGVAYIHIFVVYIIDQNGHLRGQQYGIIWETQELYNKIEFLLEENT